jgi:hypothetical protein
MTTNRLPEDFERDVCEVCGMEVFRKLFPKKAGALGGQARNVTVSPGAVTVDTLGAGKEESFAHRVGDVISAALRALTQSEQRQAATAPVGLPGNMQ